MKITGKKLSVILLFDFYLRNTCTDKNTINFFSNVILISCKIMTKTNEQLISLFRIHFLFCQREHPIIDQFCSFGGYRFVGKTFPLKPENCSSETINLIDSR